jgi:predicted nuclease with TOPRIM domain
MKKLALLLTGIVMITLAACSGSGQKKDLAMQSENDSLKSELSKRNSELDDMMGTFNEIQDGFRQINAAQERVDLTRGTISENAPAAKQKIANDIAFITKTMNENKQQIAELQMKLKKSKTNSVQLKKAIEAMQAELTEKQKQIESLQAELASKNIRIQELDNAVTGLKQDKDNLITENQAKANTVAQQDKTINTAWYVFGTKSELKAQKILVKGEVLRGTGYDKSYFTQIDIRTTKEINLYAKHATILTNHPAGSYTLTKDEKKQQILRITDPQEFWSASRYLVIQVR